MQYKTLFFKNYEVKSSFTTLLIC